MPKFTFISPKNRSAYPKRILHLSPIEGNPGRVDAELVLNRNHIISWSFDSTATTAEGLLADYLKSEKSDDKWVLDTEHTVEKADRKLAIESAKKSFESALADLKEVGLQLAYDGSNLDGKLYIVPAGISSLPDADAEQDGPGFEEFIKDAQVALEAQPMNVEPSDVINDIPEWWPAK